MIQCVNVYWSVILTLWYGLHAYHGYHPQISS
jgi:hypothetical protein